MLCFTLVFRFEFKNPGDQNEGHDKNCLPRFKESASNLCRDLCFASHWFPVSGSGSHPQAQVPSTGPGPIHMSGSHAQIQPGRNQSINQSIKWGRVQRTGVLILTSGEPTGPVSAEQRRKKSFEQSASGEQNVAGYCIMILFMILLPHARHS